jgi:ParB-like chromosome segregation protein Spo0J
MGPWRVADLVPVEYNPRKITDRAAAGLRDSVDGFGFLQPLVVNVHPGREGRIVGGAQRWQALVDLGAEHVPDLADGSPGIVLVDLAEPEERQLNLRLNIGGTWDLEALARDFDPALVASVGLDLPAVPDDLPATGGSDEDEDDGRPAKLGAGSGDARETIAAEKQYRCPTCRHEWNGAPKS